MNNELLNTYNELLAKIAALRAEAKTAASAILENGTSSYFQKYGSIVEQIFWTQYTPWFNDGDTCEFSVSEPMIVMVEDEDEDKYTEGSQLDTNIEEYKAAILKWEKFEADKEAYLDALVANGKVFTAPWDTRAMFTPHSYSKEQLQQQVGLAESFPEGFLQDTKSLISFISSIEPEIMEHLFENHVTVRITANGIETEEYRHE